MRLTGDVDLDLLTIFNPTNQAQMETCLRLNPPTIK